ncbi:MAG: 4-oxalocrotonate tautomerase [Betaproteobacteria bacterium]|nr:MAG: 4-oxalocrotonate tautomerase [Betaproteobacteria bacterium]
MPFIHIQFAAARGKSVRDETLAQTLTQLAGSVLRKKPEVTAVRVERVAPEAWFIGGRTLAQHGQASAQVQIQITAGTNSADEKERFIAAVFDELTALLGQLHPASYVVVDEIAADSWGYGGRTQAARAARPHATAEAR